MKHERNHLKNLIFRNKPLIRRSNVTKTIQTNKSHLIIWPVNHYHILSALEATVEKAVTLQDIEVQTNLHIQIRNLFTIIVNLYHQVETIHHSQDTPIIRSNLISTLIIHIQIILDYNHLSVIEMEIVHDVHYFVIEPIIWEIKLTHFYTKLKQKTQCLTQKI